MQESYSDLRFELVNGLEKLRALIMHDTIQNGRTEILENAIEIHDKIRLLYK